MNITNLIHHVMFIKLVSESLWSGSYAVMRVSTLS